jgi:hypothetical protein
MTSIRSWTCSMLASMLLALPALAFEETGTMSNTVTIQASGSAPYELGSKVWFVTKLGGVSKMMTMSVNGIPGGNATVGTINEQNGEYQAPVDMPTGNAVTITATTKAAPVASASMTLALRLAAPKITSITPTLVKCGEPYTLTVNGGVYAADSLVYVRGAPAPTTFVSPSALQVKGKSSQSGMTISIKVVNVINGASQEDYSVKVGTCTSTSTGGTSTGGTTPTPTPTPTPVPVVIGPQPAQDPALVAAARFLEQASFGPTAAELVNVKNIGPASWIAQQLALPASTIPVTTDMTLLRNTWYQNMLGGQDQLRQRMIFALSQIFVVSADKNPYANEMQPWLDTLSRHAFGNFGNLLREMTLNPSMGKYLDLGNSVLPAPNENYAREVMQLFTVGPVLLNQDGSVQTDMHGDAIPTYDQATIGDMSRALSGWTYTGPSATGINWENFTGPLQPRDKYHDKHAKTLLGGFNIPAAQSTVQDYDAVMQNLFTHPNVPPFIATRLIRHFVTSNPSPAYIQRVADVFANSATGRGDLAATLQAVLLDPEARQDQPSSTQGHLKDPMIQTLGMYRAFGVTTIDPTNLFWDYYLLGEKLLNAPSVFNFYSPLTRLPGSSDQVGPEFQIYAPSLAIARANLVYQLSNGMASQFAGVAGDPTALLNAVDAKLLQGRMSAQARQAIGTSLIATSDLKQRAITAVYLTLISAEFAVHQ